MRIEAPEITQKDNQYLLSARVSFESKLGRLPETMWFAVNDSDPCFAHGLTDAFLVSLIATAMKLGEDIRVEGKVSSSLAHGLMNYQYILSTWWPESFKTIGIDYGSLVNRHKDQRAPGVACAFSGGLNSFHAVSGLLPDNIPNKAYGITHVMMINGLEKVDELLVESLLRHKYRNDSSVLAEWGVELMVIHTNQEQFRQISMSNYDQVHTQSSALAACAHALAGVFGRFSIPGHGSYAYDELAPYGLHPAMDHHLGSDQLQVIHETTSRSRAEKLELMANFPVVQKNLDVCLQTPEFDSITRAIFNCGECEKCLTTLVGLKIMGKLDLFTTFPGNSHDEKYHRPELLTGIGRPYLEDLKGLAERHQRKDWVKILERVIELNPAKENKLES